ncbi:MAG TPA: hypothetical protein VE825_00025, partial [Terriglobales bacterium]|nr:hypothetical protein [Terriglobales bacterium]
LLFFHLRGRRRAWGPVTRTENAFQVIVHAPFQTVVPLFGASAERAWAGSHWNPQFVYPLPERDQAGEVFTVGHGRTHSTWVNTMLDLDSGRIQYVYVIPGAQVCVIDVYARPLDAATTAVKVVYQRTALDPALNGHVSEMGQQDGASGPEWETAINGYLKASPAR